MNNRINRRKNLMFEVVYMAAQKYPYSAFQYLFCDDDESMDSNTCQADFDDLDLKQFSSNRDFSGKESY